VQTAAVRAAEGEAALRSVDQSLMPARRRPLFVSRLGRRHVVQGLMRLFRPTSPAKSTRETKKRLLVDAPLREV